MSKMSYFFANISGSDAYFFKLIFALKPCVQAGRFEYHEPYDWKIFFLTYKGVLKFKKLKLLLVRVLPMKIRTSNGSNFSLPVICFPERYTLT